MEVEGGRAMEGGPWRVGHGGPTLLSQGPGLIGPASFAMPPASCHGPAVFRTVLGLSIFNVDARARLLRTLQAQSSDSKCSDAVASGHRGRNNFHARVQCFVFTQANVAQGQKRDHSGALRVLQSLASCFQAGSHLPIAAISTPTPPPLHDANRCQANRRTRCQPSQLIIPALLLNTLLN
ncbi:hypothetical protein EYF80_009636 [Liparis tanakae]|uniref:Uncharacterized protein n=1 Tax=Liparis tanakae TaxID=230148 RepID=A0A4Z2IQD5_9TELE|nr:hypothetical protein EYF80_009636 [Liparis tanakae]